jgi:hypothetical protein
VQPRQLLEQLAVPVELAQVLDGVCLAEALAQHLTRREARGERWRLEAGGWRLEAGGWRLEAGGWTLDAGRWTLDAGRERPTLVRHLRPEELNACLQQRRQRRVVSQR